MVPCCKKCLRPVLGHSGRTGMNFCTATPLSEDDVADTEAVYVEDDDSAVKYDQMSRDQILSMLAGQNETIDALKKVSAKEQINPGSIGAAGGKPVLGGPGFFDVSSLADELMKKNKLDSTSQPGAGQGSFPLGSSLSNLKECVNGSNPGSNLSA